MKKIMARKAELEKETSAPEPETERNITLVKAEPEERKDKKIVRFKKEIDKAVDQDAQTSEYLSVTCFEDGWPSSVLKQNKTVMAGRGKLKQKLIEVCRFAQREK